MKEKKSELYFEAHITEHCNLNCAGCSHYSPLAREEHIDIQTYENDCRRLSEITKGNISYIKLLGGEPLLNEQLKEIIEISRKYFSVNTKIAIITNGILLDRQKEEFWKLCNKNNIEIGISKYPVNLPIEKIKNLAETHNVNTGYFWGKFKILPLVNEKNEKLDEKLMYHFPLDISGRQDIKKSFLNCHKANNCFTLKNGRLYTCSTIPHAIHFNKYFNKNLVVSDSDSISIYEARNIDEILEFLSKPVSFCRYCMTEKINKNIKWALSRKDIKEWT